MWILSGCCKFQQIDDKKYDAELSGFGVDNVVKIGIAFREKTAVVKKC